MIQGLPIDGGQLNLIDSVVLTKDTEEVCQLMVTNRKQRKMETSKPIKVGLIIKHSSKLAYWATLMGPAMLFVNFFLEIYK